MRSIKFSHNEKSGFRAAFFCFVMYCLTNACLATPVQLSREELVSIQERVTSTHLAQSPIWRALLHADKEKSLIVDKGFILTSPHFSFEGELLETVRFIYSENKHNVCRFPARYLWLQHELNLPALSLEQCSDVAEFLQKAPVDRISLVFASENISQPSSMMGHLLIKLTGSDAGGVSRSHAISFFTDAATINLPKLLFESLVLGKEGYFSLAPYDETVQRYVVNERRGLWEYSLKLTEFQKNLIVMHLLELKTTRFLYFFQAYNCATLINYVLSLAAPGMLDGDDLWLTPVDVVKRADKAALIDETDVNAPSVWLIRMISADLTREELNQVRQEVLTYELPSIDEADRGRAFAKTELALAYNHYLLSEQKRTEQATLSYEKRLAEHRRTNFPDLDITPGKYKRPQDTPQETQVTTGLAMSGGSGYIRLDFLPVSHGLEDNNSSYFNESELKLLELSIRMPIRSDRRIELDHLDIYSIKSLLPYNAMIGGWSGKFKVGIAPRQDWRANQAFYMEGGVGLSVRLTPDVDLYELVGGGLSARAGAQLYLTAESGVVVREVFDMKSTFSATRVRHASSPGGVDTWDLSWTQSKYFGKKDSLLAVWNKQRAWSGGSAKDLFSLLYRRIF